MTIIYYKTFNSNNVFDDFSSRILSSIENSMSDEWECFPSSLNGKIKHIFLLNPEFGFFLFFFKSQFKNSLFNAVPSFNEMILEISHFTLKQYFETIPLKEFIETTNPKHIFHLGYVILLNSDEYSITTDVIDGLNSKLIKIKLDYKNNFFDNFEEEIASLIDNDNFDELTDSQYQTFFNLIPNINEMILLQYKGIKTEIESQSNVDWFYSLDDNWQIYLSNLVNSKTDKISPNEIDELLKIDYISINSHDNLSDLQPLSNFLNLNKIAFFGTIYSDFTPLNNVNIEHLFIDGWVDKFHLNDIDFLQNLKNLKSIRLEYISIDNLKPLEKLNNLNIIDLRNSEITDISFLEKAYNLKALSLENVNTNNIFSLSSCHNIDTLILKNLKIDDLSAIRKLNKLKRLIIDDLDIKDLSFIADLTNLEILRICTCGTNSLPSLSKFSQLKSLTLYEIGIESLHSLDKLNQLEELYLSKLNIIDFCIINNFYNLEILSIKDCPLETIDWIKNLTNLKYLSLEKTNVKDIFPIFNLKSLERLFLSNTQINNLSGIENLKKLESLDIDRTNVNSLDPITHLVKLNYLSFSGTSIENISPILCLKNLNSVRAKHLDLNFSGNFQEVLPNFILNSMSPNQKEAQGESLMDQDATFKEICDHLELMGYDLSFPAVEREFDCDIVECSHPLLDNFFIFSLKKINYMFINFQLSIPSETVKENKLLLLESINHINNNLNIAYACINNEFQVEIRMRINNVYCKNDFGRSIEFFKEFVNTVEIEIKRII